MWFILIQRIRYNNPLDSCRKKRRKCFLENVDVLSKIAYALRVIAIPPIMATVLILLVWVNGQAITTVYELIASFIFLVVIPVAAYPVSYLVPKIRKGGRKAQRSLAFWFAGFGYIYGIVGHKSQGLNFIYLTYLLSVLLLAVVNRFSKTRASGHACSAIWPVVIACYYYKLIGAVIGIAIYSAVFWCSLTTKRHTAGEFLLGTFTCIIAASISALLIFVLKLPL